MVECWYEPGECKANCADRGHCYAEKLDTFQVGAKIHKARRSTPSPPPRGTNNAWERGQKTDGRGVPLLDQSGEPIGTKEYADNHQKYERRRKELATHPNPFNDPQLPRA